MKNTKIFLFTLIAIFSLSFIANTTNVAQAGTGSDYKTVTINQSAFSISSSTTTTNPTAFPTLSTTGGSGAGTVSYTVTTSGTAGCSIVSGTTTLNYTGVGTCTVTATKAGGTTYNDATASATFTVNAAKTTPTCSVNNSPKTYTGSPIAAIFTCTTTGSVTNVKYNGTYLANGPTVVGTYPVTLDFAPTDTTTYNSLTNASATPNSSFMISAAKTNQSPLSLAGQTITNPAEFVSPLSATGGSGAGAITYAITSAGAGCSLSGATLTHIAGSTGSCTITATKAGGTTYNDATASATFTVNSATTLPNLTVSASSPTTATVNVAQNYTATITNSNAAMGRTSNYFFQICSSAAQATGICSTTITDKTSSTFANLPADRTATATLNNIKFDTVKTYSMRACADFTSRGVGDVITESNEGDNCGNWTDVVVTSATAVPVVTLSASPTSGTVGTNPTLTWSATNSPTGCTASGDWSGAKTTTGGSQSIGVLSIVKTYTYTLVCANVGGSSIPISATVIISALTPLPLATIDSMTVTYNGTATPSIAVPSVPYNSTVKVSWTSTGATTCTAVSDPIGFSGSGTNPSPITSPSLKKNTRFTVTCYNAASDPITVFKDVFVDPINTIYKEN